VDDLIQKEKVVVIIPSGIERVIVPLFCKICEFPMKTRDDSISFRKVGCCFRCDNRWTNTPGVDWENNKIPDKSSTEWKEYIEERFKLDKTIINFK